MMDCNKAEKLLVEYMYQELTPEKTLELEKHLHVCDNCSSTLENWRVIHRGYQRSDDVPQPAPYLKQRLLAAAREEILRKPSFAERLFFLLKPALVLPIVMLALIGVLVFPMMSTKNQELAQAPAPAKVAKPTPPVASVERKDDNAPRLTEEESERLKNLGYIDAGPAKEEEGRAASTPLDEYAEKAGSRDRDPDYKMKKALPEPKSAESIGGKQSGYEADDAISAKRQEELAPQEQQLAAPSKDVMNQPTAASPPAPAPSGIATKTEAADMRENFDRSQRSFQDNDLPRGTDEAKIAIQQDKKGQLASEFHSAGRAYQSQGEPQQAIVQFNLVLNNYPAYENAPDVLLRLGESYEQIGQYDKALETYRQLQRFTKMRKVADEKIGTLSKKQQSQEQLRSLGYVSKDKN